MSDGTISKIQLPNGNVYDIIGGAGDIAIDSTYDSDTKTVTIFGSSLEDADSTEY